MTTRYYASSIIATVCGVTGKTPAAIVGWWHANVGKLTAIFRYIGEHPGSSAADILAASLPPPNAPAGAQPIALYLAGVTTEEIALALQIGQAIALAALSPVIVPPIGVEVPDVVAAIPTMGEAAQLPTPVASAPRRRARA